MPILISFLATIAPFMRVAQCESNITNAIAANGHYGYWQFDDPTWYSTTGLRGHASNYSFEVQFLGAVELQRARGWEPWTCGYMAYR